MKLSVASPQRNNIIRDSVKRLSLSSIVLLLSAPAVSAQTITQPIIVNGSSTPTSLVNEVIDIDTSGNSAIQVKNGSLSITDSDFTLQSDKIAVELAAGSDVTIIGAAGRNASITSTNSSGYAVNMQYAAKLTLDGVNILATGDINSGIGATGVVVFGTYNQVNAELNLSNSIINTINVRAMSVRDSIINANNFSITTGRDPQTGMIAAKTHLYGVNAEEKNFIDLSDGYIETWTNYSTGINTFMDFSDTSVERLKVKNVQVVTHGNNATGIDNIATRSSITGGSVLTHGIGAHGIGASNGGSSSFQPSHVAVTGTKITTNGRQAYGLVATTSSDIQAKAVSIITSGESAAGVYSQGTGRINVSDGSTITTSGEGAHGVAVMLGSEINISGSAIKTTGENAAGLYMAGNNFTGRASPSPVTPIGPRINPSTDQTLDDEDYNRAGVSHSNVATLTDTVLDIADGSALLVLGGENNTITISGSTIKAGQGANALLFSSDVYKNEHETGFANVTATASKLSGDVLINSGSVDFDLSDKSVWSGAAKIGANDQILNSLSLDATSSWLITGDSTLNSLTNNGAVAFFQSNSNFKTLTVKSDYSSSGLFAVNTQLGDDSSATDRIIFEGAVTGNNQLAVRNAGGLGAQTVEGIKVIEIHGASDGIFTLAGRYRNHGENAVVAGAYTYKLYQGSLSDPADGDWYLRSSADDDGYQAGVPVYEVYPQFLLGLNALPTLQQRVGNRYWNHAGNQLISQGADAVTPYAPAEEAGSFTQNNGVWGRMEGSYTKMQPNSSTSGAEYDYSAYKLQAGLDGLLHENEQGKLIGGMTVHYAHGLASVWSPNDSDLGRGRIRTDGYGFGGTLTWYSDNGFYIDNQAQVTWYRSDLSYQGGQETLTDGKNNGFGYSLSSEIGKRFALDEHWSLTPQAQLHYSGVDFDGFTDVFDAAVSKERAASLQARLGLSADYQNSWRNEQGGLNRSTIYGIANLYNEFLNGTQVDVASVRFTNKSDRLWAGIGLGGTYNWNDDKYSLYGEGSVNTSLSHFGDSYTYKGTIGFRVKW